MLLDTQGLAILRTRERYVSLECGPSGGGHGHPDRLHLTLHADGVHWLPDLGTGSYVAHDLFWYRSTLAHNAPRLDGSSQPPGDAHCLAFDVRGDWAWARGRYGELGRAVASGPAYLMGVTELSAPECRARVLQELAILQPRIVVVMGEPALAELNDLDLPLGRELEARPGEVQRLTPSIEALWCPDIDASLDDETAKRAFWRAFRALGDWYADLPPY